MQQFDLQGNLYNLQIENEKKILTDNYNTKREEYYNKLQSNWNSLREYLNTRLQHSINGIRDDEIRGALDKMNELEGKDKK